MCEETIHGLRNNHSKGLEKTILRAHKKLEIVPVLPAAVEKVIIKEASD